MKIFLLLSLFFAFLKPVPGQAINKIFAVKDTALSRDTSAAALKKSGDLHPKGELKRITVNVDPNEAREAFLTVIKLSDIVVRPDYKATYWYPSPDTLGVWNAPLNITLFAGNYEFIASAKGFKDKMEEVEVGNKNEGRFRIKMLSLNYLKKKRSRWRTIRWISGVITLAAGAASYYFYNRIKTSQDKYNNAVSPDVINDERSRINSARIEYQISSGIAFTALGGFTASWLIELSF